MASKNEKSKNEILPLKFSAPTNEQNNNFEMFEKLEPNSNEMELSNDRLEKFRETLKSHRDTYMLSKSRQQQQQQQLQQLQQLRQQQSRQRARLNQQSDQQLQNQMAKAKPLSFYQEQNQEATPYRNYFRQQYREPEAEQYYGYQQQAQVFSPKESVQNLAQNSAKNSN